MPLTAVWAAQPMAPHPGHPVLLEALARVRLPAAIPQPLEHLPRCE
jgi:hypothetical protein